MMLKVENKKVEMVTKDCRLIKRNRKLAHYQSLRAEGRRKEAIPGVKVVKA